MPLSGFARATVAAQTPAQLTKWSGILNFLRVGAPAKFPDAIQATSNLLFLNRVCAKTEPHFIDSKENGFPG